MKTLSPSAVRMLFIVNVPRSADRDLANALYEILNGCLHHEVLEGGSDLHGREDALIDDMIAASIFDGIVNACKRFEGGAVGEAAYREMLQTLATLDEEGEFDNELFLHCMEDEEAYVVAACVRLKAKDGTSALVIYRNKALAPDEARRFLKREATSYLSHLLLQAGAGSSTRAKA